MHWKKEDKYPEINVNRMGSNKGLSGEQNEMKESQADFRGAT